MAVRGDVSSSVADFESKMVVDRVPQDDPLGLPEVGDLGIQRFRVDLSWTTEHVVRDAEIRRSNCVGRAPGQVSE